VAIAEPPRILYIDSSAIVKLVVREAESDALRSYLEGAELVTSEIALSEVPRAAHLRTGATEVFDQAETVLRRFDLVDLDEDLHRAAARRTPRELRTLDAIHLVSALRVGGRLQAVIAYDRRLVQAARDAGLTVDAPGAKPPAGRK
jgi:predicted nucleic acid-binding protein